MPFSIYQASAGSGKTYILVKEYLKIALKEPSDFRHILAITFTNKAAKEMKTRVLTALKKLSSDTDKNFSLKLDLEKELTEINIKENAKILLTKILHNYSNFAVTTIDSFIHKIVKSFAFELNLPPYFELDLKEELLSDRIKDKLIESIGENEEITDIFNEFLSYISLDEGSNIKNKLNSLTANISKQLFNETSPIYDKSFENMDFIKNYKEVMKEQKQTLNTINSVAKEAVKILDALDDEVKNKISRFVSLIAKLNNFRNKIFEDESKLINGSFKKGVFFKKGNDQLETELFELGFHSKIEELKNLYYDNIEKLISNRIFLKKVFDMVLIKKMKELLEDYISENDIVPISEINRRVSEIIKKDSTPFIYYKIGEYYQNYLIDEFQDTSVKQWNNLYPLIENSQAEGHFGMAVGDPKQAIYRWRGGDVSIMSEEIEKKLYDVSKINLENNYRSSKTIIEFNNFFFSELLKNTDNEHLNNIYKNNAQNTIKTDEGFVKVKLFDVKSKSSAIEVIIPELISTIQGLISKQIYNYKDIAILVDKNRDGEIIANALFEKGIKVTSSESLLIANEPIILLLINTLKWLIAPDNTLLITKIIYFFNLISDNNNEMLFLKLEEKQFFDNKEIDLFNMDALEEELEMLQNQKDELLTYSLYEIVESLIKIFELNENYAKTGGFLERFLGVIKESDKDNIYNFLEWWSENSNSISLTSQEDFNAVKIVTIHKAKGLEFPVVFIPFANWDYKLNHQHDIWLKNKSGINHLVTPKDDLENSNFKDSYLTEKKMYFMDSVNKLYVGFTRAISSLYVFGYLKKNNNIVHLIKETLFENSSQSEGEELIYEKGKFPSKFNLDYEGNTSLTIKKFLISDWKSKLTVVASEDINKEKLLEKMGEEIKIDGEHFNFFKRIINEVGTHKNISNTRFIFPNKKGARFFEAIYKKLHNEKIFAISFDDYVSSKIAKIKGYEKAEFMDILFHLIEIMPKKIEEDFNSFFNWSKSVIRDFNELDSNLIEIDDFFKYLSDLSDIDERFIDLDDEIKQKHIETMKEFRDLYHYLNTALLKDKKIYMGKLYKFFYSELNTFINKNDEFIFIGFNKFTKTELLIIEKLLNEDRAKIYFDIDNYYYENNEHEAGELLRRNIKELDMKNIKWINSQMENKNINISINATSSVITEIKALSSKLKRLIRANKIHSNNTAIILENKEYLTPLLSSLPEELKELNISINYPLNETLIYRLIKTTISLHENNYKDNKKVYKKDVLNLLIHPYFKIIAMEHNLNSFDIVKILESNDKKFIYLKKLKEYLGDIIYDNIFKNWKKKEDFITTINFINDTLNKVLLNDETFKNRKPELVILNYFRKATNIINDNIENLSINLSARTVWRLYNDYFSSQRVPFDTPLLNGLQILSLEDTRGLDFENILFLSVNENIFPYRKETNTLIPYETRKLYNLETYETKESDSAYLFYRLIQHAKIVEIFYHDNIKDKGEKSRFIEQIMLEYSSVNKNLKLTNNYLTFDAQKNNFKKIKVSKRDAVVNKLKNFNISPSFINTYRKCSLRFYFDYVLKLKDFEKKDNLTDPRIFGLIFHETLEQLYKNIKFIDEKIILELESSYKNILTTISRKYLEEIDKGYGKLIYNILDKTISNFLKTESKTPFEIIKLEEKLERKFNFISENQTSVLNLKGAVDRIDIVKNNDNEFIRIIDYKTGKSTDFKQVKVIDNSISSISLQLLHYSYCYNTDKSFKSSAFFVMDRAKIQRDLLINKETVINNELKEEIFLQFENLLIEIFNEIFNKKLPFIQTEDKKTCNVCLYSDICGKNNNLT